MGIQIKYNDFLITQLFDVLEVKRNPFPNRTINSLSIPNRNGEIFQNATFGSKEIEVSFIVRKEYRASFDGTKVYDSEFNNYIRSLSFYLATDEPAKLVFSDEPNKFYWAIVESIDLQRTLHVGEGTLRFICSDPLAYSIEEKYFTAVNQDVKVENFGTFITYPKFSTTFTKDVTSLTVISNQGVIQIGDSNNVGKQGEAINKDIIMDTCDSVTGWYAGSETILALGGSPNKYHIDSNLGLTVNTGNLMLNQAPTAEIPEGETSHGYTGGFFIKNLPEPAKYWKVKEHFNFSSRNSLQNNSLQPEQMGCIALVGYDINNKVLFNFIMADNLNLYECNVPFFYLGQDNLLWDERLKKLKAGTTKRYANKVITDENWTLPENANLIMETEVKAYSLTAKADKCPIYSRPVLGSKLITAVPKGSTFVEKRSVPNRPFFEVYLTDDKTTTGYMYNKDVIQSENGSFKTVTYEETVYSTSGGRWDDFSGSITVECIPYSKRGTGRVWKMTLWKNKWGTGHIEQAYSKTWYDPEGTRFTDAGDLAKIGIYMATKEDADMVKNTAIRQLQVVKYNSNATDDDFNLIASKGDTIEIDCDAGTVTKNGEPFMENVDVGSDFFGIPPMTQSNIKVISDDTEADTEVSLRERYI